jgi:hypothetical protein
MRQAAEAEVYEFIEDQAHELKDRQLIGRNRKLTAATGRDAYFIEKIQDSLSRVFQGKTFKPSAYALRKSHSATKRVVVDLWSDLHIGSDLDPRECPIAFGPVEEARRMAKLALETAEYKTRYRDNTSLSVILLGDIIEGKLHDILAAAPRAEQICRAIHVISQALAFLGQHFKEINVYCNGGNHDRDKSRHPERATSAKWDGDGTVIYYGIKKALQGMTNIKVHIPRTPFIEIPVFSNVGMAAHGDGMLFTGNPGQNINSSKANGIANQINAGRPEGKGYVFFLEGHTHQGASLVLENGATWLWNGCMVPPGGYTMSLNVLTHTQGQWLFESVPDYPVGDMRFLRVNEKDDKNAALDKIVAPFVDFDE